MGQDIIFEVPALGNGYYCDFSTSYFRCRVDVTLTNTVTQAAGVANPKSNGYVRFERGPESMFRRVMIQDASGNLLESFENYNDLYCLQELLTNNRLNREGPGTFLGEGLVLPGYGTIYPRKEWWKVCDLSTQFSSGRCISRQISTHVSHQCFTHGVVL